MSTSGGTSGNGLLTASAHLTTAALKTLFSAPTVIVAAAGAGKMIVALETVGEYVPTSGNLAVVAECGLFLGAGSPVLAGLVDVAPESLIGLQGAGPPVHQVVHGAGLNTAGVSSLVATTLGENAPVVVGADTGDPQQVGPITALTIAAAGSNYAVNDTGTIATDQYGGGATYRVTSVAPVTGAVTGLVVTAGGTGYGVGDTKATATGGAQPGIGVNLTVTPATVDFRGDLYVTVTYQILTLH